MYTTAPDVLDKKIKALDQQIQEEAIRKANDALLEVRQESEKERILRQKEEEYEQAIDVLAKMILEENKQNIGENMVEKAKDKIDKKNKKANKKTKKEVEENEEEQKTIKRAGRPRKLK